MYIEDFLTACEKALGYAADADAGVIRRETRVLAEIALLRRPKAPKAKRILAADKRHAQEVTRDVTWSIVSGKAVKQVARQYGLSESQARRAAASEVQLACREALAGEGTPGIETLRWVADSDKRSILGKAQSKMALVQLALKQHWAHQDAPKGKV